MHSRAALLFLLAQPTSGQHICDGVDLLGPAKGLLSGKHLRVLEMPWYPFAIKDDLEPLGWRGYDIDLISEVALMLNFTFDIIEEAALSGETYTQMLARTVNTADLWLSWWERDAERMNGAAMLFGHIDSSPVLVSPPPKPLRPKLSFFEVMITFFLPFEPLLWTFLFAMIISAGIVDWLLERGSGGTITQSVYEYSGGVLWGGFQYPMTRVSAVYQVFNGLLVLIIVAVYTANLASYMTISSQSTGVEYTSVDELVAAGQSACSIGSYATQGTLEAIFTSLTFDSSFDGPRSIASGLVDGACVGGAIVPRIDYDTMRYKHSRNCELAVQGTSLFFSTAGWVTNLNNALCVQRAVEAALHEVQASGRLYEIQTAWLPARTCGAGSSTAELSAGTKGRRLAPEGLSQRGQAHPPGRRMAAAGGSAGSAAGGATSDMPTSMTMLDFSGVFIFWIIITIVILTVKVLAVCFVRHRSRQEKKRSRAISQRYSPPKKDAAMKKDTARRISHGDAAPSVGITRVRRGSIAVMDTLFGEGDTKERQEADELNELGVDTNNTVAMLRFLVGECVAQKRAATQQVYGEAEGDGDDLRFSQSRVMTRGRSGAALSVEVVTDRGVEGSRGAVADGVELDVLEMGAGGGGGDAANGGVAAAAPSISSMLSSALFMRSPSGKSEEGARGEEGLYM